MFAQDHIHPHCREIIRSSWFVPGGKKVSYPGADQCIYTARDGDVGPKGWGSFSAGKVADVDVCPVHKNVRMCPNKLRPRQHFIPPQVFRPRQHAIVYLRPPRIPLWICGQAVSRFPRCSLRKKPVPENELGRHRLHDRKKTEHGPSGGRGNC